MASVSFQDESLSKRIISFANSSIDDPWIIRGGVYTRVCLVPYAAEVAAIIIDIYKVTQGEVEKRNLDILNRNKRCVGGIM